MLTQDGLRMRPLLDRRRSPSAGGRSGQRGRLATSHFADCRTRCGRSGTSGSCRLWSRAPFRCRMRIRSHRSSGPLARLRGHPDLPGSRLGGTAGRVPSTMGTAVHLSIDLLAMADDRTAAMGAARRHLVDGALKTVKCRCRAVGLGDREGLVVVVTTQITSCHVCRSLLPVVQSRVSHRVGDQSYEPASDDLLGGGEAASLSTVSGATVCPSTPSFGWTATARGYAAAAHVSMRRRADGPATSYPEGGYSR